MIITIPFAVLSASLLVGGALIAAETEQERLLERVRADHVALERAERDFRVRSENGQLGAVEATDYLAFLSRLRVRVAEGCAALAAAGAGAPPVEVPCVRSPAPASRSLGAPGAGTADAGRADALDARLRAGLSEFDEMLLREQERIKAAAPRSPESGAGTGSGGRGVPGQGAAGDRAASETGGETGGRPRSSGQGGLGSGGRAGARGPPADVADASGDDVVARQLREAAEKETDPELQEKLWEEYRNYKRGAGG